MGISKGLRGTIVVCLVFLIIVTGWFAFTLGWGNEKVAWVGDDSISRKELETKLIARYGKTTLDEMVNSLVIEKEAENLGLSVSEEEIQEELLRMKEGYGSEGEFYQSIESDLGMNPEELGQDIRLNLLLEKLATKDIHISEAEAQAYYTDHEELYETPESVHLLQMALDTAEEAAQAILELKEGADFSTLAKERSKDVLTAANGGDLGIVILDDPFLPLEILDVATTLNENETSDVIPIGDDFFIIKMIEKHPSKMVPYEEVKAEIIRELALSQVPSITELIKQLRTKYDVKTEDL
jgi:foldase protein PrsA